MDIDKTFRGKYPIVSPMTLNGFNVDAWVHSFYKEVSKLVIPHKLKQRWVNDILSSFLGKEEKTVQMAQEKY
jgi:hypothetical protein